MKSFFCTILCFISICTFGQIDSTIIDTNKKVVIQKPIKPGSITYFSSKKVDELVKLHKKINKENCPNIVKGWRVQIFSYSGNDGIERSNKYFNQFLIAYPDVAAYKQWDPPSHKVRVGDCRTHIEADQIKELIKLDFPHAFVVPDYISSPYAIDCEEMEIPTDSLGVN